MRRLPAVVVLILFLSFNAYGDDSVMSVDRMRWCKKTAIELDQESNSLDDYKAQIDKRDTYLVIRKTALDIRANLLNTFHGPDQGYRNQQLYEYRRDAGMYNDSAREQREYVNAYNARIDRYESKIGRLKARCYEEGISVDADEYQEVCGNSGDQFCNSYR